MSTSASPGPRTRRRTGILLVALVGGVTLILALTLGPRPPILATARQGDPELAARLAEHAEPGHHHLGAFTTVAGETTFAGLGADEHTEFEIGSVTKTFTAEILRNQITAGNPYRDISRDKVMAAALATEPEGRGEVGYSNFGFALLGQLLAIEAGTSFADLLQSQILDPLGMTDTYLMTDGAVPAGAPRGLTPSGRTAQPWEMGAYNPAGGIRSTPTDMARYVDHLLAAGLPDFTWFPDDAGRAWHNGGTSYSTMLIIDPRGQQAVFVAGDTSTRVESVAAALSGKDS